jgi:hypothetical protein
MTSNMTMKEHVFRSVPALVLSAILTGCGAAGEGAEPSALPAAPRAEEAGLSASASSCTPLCGGHCTPVLLGQASGLDKPILPFGKYVFFSGAITYEASYSFFGRAYKLGTSSLLLAQNMQRPAEFLSNGTSAYALLRYPGSTAFSHLNQLGEDGSVTPVPGIDGSRSISITAVDATHLYALDLGDESVWSTPLTGGAWRRVTRPLANVAGRSVRVDSTSVYIVADDVANNLSIIWKASKRSPSTPTKLVTLPGSIVSLTMDDTDLYFSNRTKGLFKVSKSGGTVTQLASTATDLSIAVDAERYYWFNGTALTATCKNGSGSQVLATVASTPQTQTPDIISVDAEGVYWRNSYQVWKVAK